MKRGALSPGGAFVPKRSTLLAAAGGLAFALAAPPTDLYPLVVVGVGLLGASLAGFDEPPSPAEPPGRFEARVGVRRAIMLGIVWGTTASLVGLRFVPPVIQRFTPLGLVPAWLALLLLAVAQSLPWALCAAVTSLASRRARLPFEIALGAGVFAALACPALFAWTPAGLVSPWPSFVQLADVIGERGVSALFAVGGGLFVRAAWMLRERQSRGISSLRAALLPALGAVALFATLALHGSLRVAAIARASLGLPTVRVGLVDQDVGPEERWKPENFGQILHSLRKLTVAAEAEGAELTVWPEAAYPYVLEHASRRAPPGASAVSGGDIKGPVLFGLVTREPPVLVASVGMETDTYNSATLVLPDGTMQPPADKLELLAFGEAVPFGDRLPWLRRLFQRGGTLLPGLTPRALLLRRGIGAPARMAVLNCYEDTLPSVGRRLARELTPNLLVNVTNDAWFFGTREPELHARLAAMRAVEARLDLVRSVNMGVASWVDAAGVVRARRVGGGPGALLTAPALRSGEPTLYARLGDAPLWTLFVLGALVTTVLAWRSRVLPRRERDKRD